MASKGQDDSAMAALVKQKGLPWWVKSISEREDAVQATFPKCACNAKNARVRVTPTRSSEEALASVITMVSVE